MTRTHSGCRYEKPRPVTSLFSSLLPIFFLKTEVIENMQAFRTSLHPPLSQVKGQFFSLEVGGLQLWGPCRTLQLCFSVPPHGHTNYPHRSLDCSLNTPMHFLPKAALTQLTLKINGLKDRLSISQTPLIASLASAYAT